eukprot:Pompholyxophrys_punicea_v1_NODE_251_length_2530_cov_7.915152.p1 type:complete len:323 gc:universal NODE_251_length_2530_cov_7.915152:1587-619(-)
MSTRAQMETRLENEETFSVVVNFSVKNYEGSRTALHEYGKETILCKDVQEFKNILFAKLSHHILGKFTVNGSKPNVTFVGANPITQLEFGENIWIRTETTKKSQSLVEFESLKNWPSEDLTKINYSVILYVYGKCTHAIYSEIESLSNKGTDKSGSASVIARGAVRDKLKEKHGNDFVASHENDWDIWAGILLRRYKVQEQLDSAILEPPPDELIHYFLRKYNGARQVVKNLQSGCGTSKNIITGMEQLVDENYESEKKFLMDRLATLEQNYKVAKKSLKNWRSMIEGIESDLSAPVPPSASVVELEKQVAPAPDREHQEIE